MEEAAQASAVDIRLIVSLTREHFDMDLARKMLGAIGAVAHPRIVGIDLTGDESVNVPGEASRVFREAKSLGLGVTIHAGETGPSSNIRWAIEECAADRVGHAVAAAGDAGCLELLRERGTCVEVCLTSNLLTGAVQSLDAHPVSVFVDEGVTFVLCSDNPQMHLRPLSFEYEVFSSICPASDALDRQAAVQRAHAFAKHEVGPLAS
jgi:adenosine deaminase